MDFPRHCDAPKTTCIRPGQDVARERLPRLSDKPAHFQLAQAKKLKSGRKDQPALRPDAQLQPVPAGEGGARHDPRRKLGEVRKVVVEYPQGWLATRLEATGQKQAGWPHRSKRSGAAGSIGDIGTHAENLAEYVTGLQIENWRRHHNLCERPQAEDDGNMLLRFKGGAKGVLHCSRSAIGEENNINIASMARKAGSNGTTEEPNSMLVEMARPADAGLRTANGYLGANAKAAARTPHRAPEGYLEAFANIYKNFAKPNPRPGRSRKLARRSRARLSRSRTPSAAWPSSKRFVKSSRKNAAWTKLDVVTRTFRCAIWRTGQLCQATP